MPVMVWIEVDASGPTEALERVQAALEHMERPLADIAPLWSERMKTLFATAPWPPLKASTVALKQRLGYPADPLVRTGALKDRATGGSWTISGQAAGAEARLEGLPTYGKFHITSTKWMVARDWTMIDDATVDKMAMKLIEYLVEGW